ncbi:MAG: DUF6754 domain-containing protein [Candidatus Muiribacteriota bacterium]
MKKKIFLLLCFLLFSTGVVFAVEADITTAEETTERFFAVKNLPVLFGLLFLGGMIVYFIEKAKKGQKIFIRKIAGLNAIDDALGRSTEMGKPALYVPGIMGIEHLETLASVSILGHISKKIANYESDLKVPVRDPLVYSTAQEVIKESFLSAGRPDAYKDNMVEFLTSEQFGYVAGISGYMVREKPAATFFLGCFYAESLLLAETGNSIGAIQVAGTANPSQIPFFITACDYTLIGEELYAAGAYLSDDGKSRGSLKGQDMGKAAVMTIIILFTLITIVYSFTLSGQEITEVTKMQMGNIEPENWIQRVYFFFRNIMDF